MILKTTIFATIILFCVKMENVIINQYKGYFWLTDDENCKLPGILTRYSNEMELELIGSFKSKKFDLERIINNCSFQNHTILLHGIDSNAMKISIIATLKFFHIGEIHPFSINKYIVRLLVLGKFISGLEEKCDYEAIVKIPELSFWCPPKLISHGLSTNGVRIEASFQDSEIPLFKHTLEDGIVISLERDCQTSTSPCNLNPMIEQWTTFHISSRQNISIKQIINIILKFEKLLSFATLRDCHFSEIKLLDHLLVEKVSSSNNYYLPIYLNFERFIEVNCTEIKIEDFLFRYDNIEDSFSDIISKWFAKDENLLLIINHLIDSVLVRNHYISTTFMTVIQGIDGFWQRYREDDYKKKKNLKKNYRVSLSEEIIELLDEFSYVFKKHDLNINVDALKDTRDYYSHLLKVGEKANVKSGIELFRMTNLSRILLMCCVMQLIGMKKQTIEHIMDYFISSNKYNVLGY